MGAMPLHPSGSRTVLAHGDDPVGRAPVHAQDPRSRGGDRARSSTVEHVEELRVSDGAPAHDVFVAQGEDVAHHRRVEPLP